MLILILVLALLIGSAATASGVSEQEQLIGEGLSKRHRQIQAIPHFNNAILTDPNNLNAYADRADAYIMIDQNESAIRDLSHVLQFSKSSALYRKRSKAWASCGKLEEAIRDMTEAIMCAPNTKQKSTALSKRADLYRENGKNNAALADISEAISLRQTANAGLFYQRGCVLFALKNYDGALKDFSKAIDIMEPHDDKSSSYYSMRSKTFQKLGNSNAAKADLDKAASDTIDYH